MGEKKQEENGKKCKKTKQKGKMKKIMSTFLNIMDLKVCIFYFFEERKIKVELTFDGKSIIGMELKLLKVDETYNVKK